MSRFLQQEDAGVGKYERKKHGRKHVVLKILGVFLLVILLAVVGVVVYADHLLGNMNYVSHDAEYTVSPSEADAYLENDEEIETANPEETYIKLEDIAFTEPASVPSETPDADTPAIYGDHLVNILLVGQDRRSGEGRQRSDAMILVSFNKSDNTITLTSFMRDQYVQIPGYKPNKLNSAYSLGGMGLLSSTLELNFGVKLDGIVEVDFTGFERIIDLLGGVNITLTQAEANLLNQRYEHGAINAPVVVGKNHLNGNQALSYARIRSLDSDYARTGRQRTVIKALIEAYTDLTFAQMLRLLEDIFPLVTTDMTKSQIVGYATELIPMLATAKINTMQIPIEGTFQGGNAEVRPGFIAWFQYNIDFEANQAALWEIFRDKD